MLLYSRHTAQFLFIRELNIISKTMKKFYFILSLLLTLVLSANSTVMTPFVTYPEDYTGTQFKATWGDSGADTYLFSLYTLGSDMKTFNETFADVNQKDGKLNTENPNVPAGFDLDIANNGSKDVVYYNDRNHIVLDANNDMVSTSLLVGGNLSKCVFKANLINAKDITRDNSSIFKVTLYDKEGDLMSSGQIEAYYFFLREDFDLFEAFKGARSNIGKVTFELVKDDKHNVGDIAINSIEYEYPAPVYVITDKEVKGFSYTVTDLDAEKVYYYYVKGKQGGEVSDMSYIMYVDGFLNVSTLPASNITSTSYTANWEYLPKALGYYVQPYRFDVVEEATTTNTIDEKFSKSTEGTTDQPVNVTQENLDEYTDCAGWSGRNICLAEGMLGAQDGRFPYNLSYVHSPVMNLSAQNGKYKVHLKATGTPGDYLSVYHVGYMEDNKLVIHKATFDENGKIDEEWEMKDGDSETMLSFEESKLKRFFLDEVTVSQGIEKGDVIIVKDELIKITDPKTTSYNFTNLEENKKYGYQVTGWRNDDLGNEIVSATSEIVYADLSTATGINSNLAANNSVSINGNVLSVALTQDAPIYVITLDGCTKQIVSGKAGVNTLMLTAGNVYIIKVGGRAYKVMAR